MVVDPGLHLMGWSRDKARRFMGESGRFSPEQLDQMVQGLFGGMMGGMSLGTEEPAQQEMDHGSES